MFCIYMRYFDMYNCKNTMGSAGLSHFNFINILILYDLKIEDTTSILISIYEV